MHCCATMQCNQYSAVNATIITLSSLSIAMGNCVHFCAQLCAWHATCVYCVHLCMCSQLCAWQLCTLEVCTVACHSCIIVCTIACVQITTVCLAIVHITVTTMCLACRLCIIVCTIAIACVHITTVYCHPWETAVHS